MTSLFTARCRYNYVGIVRRHALLFFGLFAVAFVRGPIAHAIDGLPVAPVRAAEEGWRIGMEVEIAGHSALRNLMPYFDLNVSVGRLNLTKTEIDDYLTPDTFDRLTLETQKRLLGDTKFAVNIELRPIEIAGAPKVSTDPIVNTARSNIVAPMGNRTSGGLILPKDYNATEGHREIILTPEAKVRPNEVAAKQAPIQLQYLMV